MPKQFQETREDVLLRAIADIKLAALVVSNENIEAAHVPMVATQNANGDLVLQSHVARPNPIWRMAGEGCQALAIFQGPQAYIHPGWFPAKREHGKAVPTWNYIAVHVHGRLSSTDDPDWLRRHLDHLTEQNEVGRPAPWAVSDAPPSFIETLLGAIVGLELLPERIEGAWKMLQHHPDANRLGVIDGLSHSNSSQDRIVAEVMSGLERSRQR
ncbi:MAG: FMN-binding negative transcriptional regulator [Sphingomonadaceae bacterium]|nr:FMN-binding negative transcriptional regulator [Sphingomonadaceae bacterium]